MNEKIIEWFTEKYAIGDLFSKNYISVISAVLCISLYTSQNNGIYLSSILNLINSQPLNFIEEKTKIYNLPFFVYLYSIILSLVIPKIMLIISKKYFYFVCNIEAQKKAIIELLKPNPSITIEKNEVEFSRRMHSISKELDERRNSVKKMISLYLLMSTIGTAVISSSIYGNLLDIVIGLLLFMTSFAFLHQSVKIFISKVVPWYGIYNQFSKELDLILRK